MKALSAVCLAVLCVALLAMVACSAAQIEEGAKKVQYMVGGAAPLLPPPFSLIASGVASLAGVVGSIAAGKVKERALIQQEAPHGLATFMSDHHYLYPAMSALIGILQSSHLINISGDELGTMMSLLAAPPMAAQVFFSKNADKKADQAAVAASVAPAPAAPLS